MIFGNFAENYEFAAMKSAGISLQRAMLSVSVFILLLSITTFFFANNVIPWGEYKSRNLRRQIAVQAPKMLITEGQFNKLGNITIKVEKKYGPDNNLLKDVTLFMTKNGKNKTAVKAKSGELITSKKTNTLQLVLNDGNFYEDIHSKDPRKNKKKPHVKSYFKKYIKNIDPSKLIKAKKAKEMVTYRMLKINELIPVIDSIEQKITKDNKKDLDNIYNGYLLQKRKRKVKKTTTQPTIRNKKIDKKFSNKYTIKKTIKDTIPFNKKSIMPLFDNKDKIEIYKMAITNSKSNLKKIENRETILDNKKSNLNLHKLALQKKFALAFSCFILFFIGAPLGAIIRKGGMGLPMVLAIVLFLSYYFIGLFAENFAKKGQIPTFLGAWLSTFILFPLGIVLTKNATSDKGVFSTDAITLFFTNIWRKITNKKDSKIA